MVVVAAVVVVVVDVVSRVVNGRELLGDKLMSLCVLGGNTEPEKTVDSVCSSGVVAAACVKITVVGAAVGSAGAVVGGAWVVVFIVEVGVVVEASVAGVGAGLLE